MVIYFSTIEQFAVYTAFLLGVFVVKNFAEFLKVNKEKIYSHAEKNTPRNSNGDAVIFRDDPWFYEDEWDDYYQHRIIFNRSGGFLLQEARQWN